MKERFLGSNKGFFHGLLPCFPASFLCPCVYSLVHYGTFANNLYLLVILCNLRNSQFTSTPWGSFKILSISWLFSWLAYMRIHSCTMLNDDIFNANQSFTVSQNLKSHINEGQRSNYVQFYAPKYDESFQRKKSKIYRPVLEKIRSLEIGIH